MSKDFQLILDPSSDGILPNLLSPIPLAGKKSRMLLDHELHRLLQGAARSFFALQRSWEEGIGNAWTQKEHTKYAPNWNTKGCNSGLVSRSDTTSFHSYDDLSLRGRRRSVVRSKIRSGLRNIRGSLNRKYSSMRLYLGKKYAEKRSRKASSKDLVAVGEEGNRDPEAKGKEAMETKAKEESIVLKGNRKRKWFKEKNLNLVSEMESCQSWSNEEKLPTSLSFKRKEDCPVQEKNS